MMVTPRRRWLQLASVTLAGLLGPHAALVTQAADLRDIVAATKASVLPVGTYNATDSPRFGFRGSGFVVGDGTLLVTNFHVLPTSAGNGNGNGNSNGTGASATASTGNSASPEADGAPRIAVLASRRADGTAELRSARVVAVERTRDLAVLRLEGPPLAALPLAASEPAREGQSIALMGFPVGGSLGFAPVTHRGIVASVTTAALPAATAAQLDSRALSRLREGNFELLQLDATAYPGNSGGPVLDADSGRVIGVVSMVLVKGSRESALSSPTGITYAVPVQHVLALLEDLRAGRAVTSVPALAAPAAAQTR